MAQVLTDDSFGGIGSYKESDLTEPQFQSLHGNGWVLANGQSSAGSRYQTLTGKGSVPDRRGRVGRMKDNGSGVNPGGDLALGANQSDNYKNHGHTTNETIRNLSHRHYIVHHSDADTTLAVGANHTVSQRDLAPAPVDNRYNLAGNADFVANMGKTGAEIDNSVSLNHDHDVSVNSSTTGTTETRSKNTTVNFFIRIN